MTVPTPTDGIVLLRDAIDLPEQVSATDYVLQLQTGVERAQSTLDDYVVTPALATAFSQALGFVRTAITDNKDQGAFIHGSFGSGKSHFMAVLHLLLAGNPQARSLPGLQQVVSEYEALLLDDRAPVLTLDFHLIGATSFEDAIFGGYLRQIAARHPEATPPVLHRTDALFDDAAGIRAAMGDEAFLAGLGGASASGWAKLSGGWTAESYDAAAAAPVGDGARERLAAALVASYLKGYTHAGEWEGLDRGLAIIAEHAKSLGYHAVVLFLDELVLWLASRLADTDFVASEGAKVAKLVETGIGVRAIPLVSFVARQRDLKDFLGDSVPGAQKVAVGQAFSWWEDRFNRIVIAASDLADVAHRRLLTPSSEAGAAALRAALARVKASNKAWDALLVAEEQSGETDFAKVYPFSPALVDTLVALSNLLQRERTALKVMARLLARGRDTLRVTDVIPVGDLYDEMVEGGDDPLTPEMTRHFGIARDLYHSKLRPVLLAEHGLTEAEVASGAGGDPSLQVRLAAFRTDDRLVKTLLIAALAPAVAALKNLTASRLAYLNFGTVTTPIPGTEVSAVLAKLKSWAQQVGELSIGDGNDPIVRLELSGVDYDSVIEQVRAEDNTGSRRTLLRRLVFEQLGISAEGLLNETPHTLVWRGTKRTIDVVFGNIRDRDAMPNDVLRASGEQWRLVVDYPFDPEPGMGPQDDIARIDELRREGVVSRTVAWVPGFFTTARLDDLGTLVLLEHLLRGEGAAFDQHSLHLAPDQRPTARNHLDSRRRSLRAALDEVIKEAYGAAVAKAADIDASHGALQHFATLDDGLTMQPPVGATLRDALANVADQMLSSQYPDHPAFDPPQPEIGRSDLNTVLEHVARAVSQDGRIDPVETAKRARLRRVANVLGVGECYESHYVFSTTTFPWRNRFVQWASGEGLTAIPVSRARTWLAPYGMPREMENLVIAAWALLEDKQWTEAGAAVTVTNVQQVTDDLELRDPTLPDEALWPRAVERAAALFGVTVAPLRSAATLASLASGIRSRARELNPAAGSLVVELTRHAAELGLNENSPRLVSARSGAELLDRLAVESDDVVLVDILAQAALPAEPQPLAKSMSSAASVASTLAGVQWSLLTGIRDIQPTDPRHDQAQSLLEALSAAAGKDELHAPLAPALVTASNSAASLLASGSVTTPAPPVPPPATPPVVSAKHVDEIVLDGIDDRLEEIGRQIRTQLQAAPGRTVRIEWWLE